MVGRLKIELLKLRFLKLHFTYGFLAHHKYYTVFKVTITYCNILKMGLG